MPKLGGDVLRVFQELSVIALRDLTDAKTRLCAKIGKSPKMENRKKWNFWKMGKNKSGE